MNVTCMPVLWNFLPHDGHTNTHGAYPAPSLCQPGSLGEFAEPPVSPMS